MLKKLALIAAVEARTIVFYDDTLKRESFTSFKSLFAPDSVFHELSAPLVESPLSAFSTVVLANAGKFGFLEDRVNKYRPWDQDVQYSAQVSINRKQRQCSYQQLLDFVDNGGNLIVFSAVKGASEEVKKLINELGMEFSETGEFETSKSLAPVVSGEIAGKLKFSGKVNFAPSNDLVFPVISEFVGALQARNGARAVVVPSWEPFSDKSLQAHPANLQLLKEIIAWGSGEKAVLRARDLKHHRIGETDRPYMYRMSDEISLSVVIEEKLAGAWVPFVADDVLLEYTMIDPYVRLPLTYEDGKYSITFKAPDVYGIFKFVIDYRRKGYTHLKVEEEAALRNFKHSDYERFIFEASPHYGTCFVSALAVGIFAAFFAFGEDKLKKA